jgi:hypothetical protein
MSKVSRIVRATPEEKAAYKLTGPVYPLFGWVMVGETKIAVEDLGEWAKPDPQYEAIAPKGHHFSEVGECDCDSGLHTLLGVNQADLRMRLSHQDIVKCTRAEELAD